MFSAWIPPQSFLPAEGSTQTQSQLGERKEGAQLLQFTLHLIAELFGEKTVKRLHRGGGSNSSFDVHPLAASTVLNAECMTFLSDTVSGQWLRAPRLKHPRGQSFGLGLVAVERGHADWAARLSHFILFRASLEWLGRPACDFDSARRDTGQGSRR